MESIKKIAELLPIISVVLIYWGFCFLAGYYSAFNINIIVLITPTEIIFSFLYFVNAKLVKGALCLTVMGVFYLIRHRNTDVNNVFNQPVKVKTKTEIHLGIGVCLFSFFILPAALLLQSTFPVISKKLVEFFPIYTTMVFAVIAIFEPDFLSPLKAHIKKHQLLLFAVGIVYVGVWIWLSRYAEAELVKASGLKSTTVFKYNGVLFKMDNKEKIGSTANYFFLYDSKLKRTYIFERSKMDSVSFSSN